MELKKRGETTNPDSLYNNWVNSIGTKNKYVLGLKTIEAYSKYIDETSPDMIPVYQYLKLSQLYIFQGNIIGALEIIKLASLRYYLTNSLIVIQSWLLLCRLNSLEADKYISYLCSSIMLESRNCVLNGDIILESSNLKLKYVYLFCALHQIKKAHSSKQRHQKEEYMKIFKALLTEAYIFYFDEFKSFKTALDWFSQETLWWGIALDLIDTPFLLLAEDALWECFIRNSLSNKALSKLYDNIKNTNRDNESESLLIKAFKKNPWNLFCRKKLFELSEDWKSVIITQESYLPKIQGCIRGWRLRRNFESIRNNALVLLQIYKNKVDNAESNFSKLEFKYLSKIFIIWKIYSSDLKKLKKKSAVTLQKFTRRIIAKSNFIKSKNKVYAANKNYVVALNLLFDIRRSQMINKWHEIYTFNIRTKAADCISAFITINANSKIFLKAVEQLMFIINQRKAFSNKLVFYHWRERYVKKVRLQARVSIRFQIRNIFRKREELKKELELKATLAKLQKIQTQSSFIPNSFSVYKKFWNIWLSNYKNHKATRLINLRVHKICQIMRKYCAKYSDKVLIRKLRVQKEYFIYLQSKIKYRAYYNPFTFWCQSAMARLLQRAVRIFLSKRKLNKKKLNNSIVNDRFILKRSHTLKRIIFRWKKCMYLNFRERYRASKRITRTIRMYNFKTKISFNLNRKINLSKFCNSLSRFCLAHYYHLVKYRILSFDIQNKINALFVMIHKANLKIGFNYFLNSCLISKRNDKIFSSLETLLVHNKINKSFWHEAYKTVKFTNHNGIKLKNGLYIWEILIPINFTRISNIRLFQLNKAFKILITMYRSRNRHRREIIKSFSKQYFNQHLMGILIDRNEKRTLLSATIKGYLVSLKTRPILLKSRLMYEYGNLINHRYSRKNLRKSFLNFLVKFRASKRLKRFYLTCAARFKLKRKRSKRLMYQSFENLILKKRLENIKRFYLNQLFKAYFELTVDENLNDLTEVTFDASSFLYNSLHSSDLLIPNRSKILRQSSRLLASRRSNINTEKLNDKDFQSLEFFSHLFKIKKSGVFYLDCITNQLTDKELSFCIKSSDVIICSKFSEDLIFKILGNFNGRKIALCDGAIDAKGVHTLIKIANVSSNSYGISLHLTNVQISYNNIKKFILNLKSNNAKNLRELSVDAYTCGHLGLLYILYSIAENKYLERFFIDFNRFLHPDQFMLGYLVRRLSINCTIQELHISGLSLSNLPIRALIYSCKNGLNCLNYLKFISNQDTSPHIETLMQICKERQIRSLFTEFY